MSEFTLNPIFNLIEKTTFEFNNESIECFSLDGKQYVFGVTIADKLNKTPSNLYQTIRKLSWKENIIFNLPIPNHHSAKILQLMGHQNVNPAFKVLRVTKEFKQWLSKSYRDSRKRKLRPTSSYKLSGNRILISGKIYNQLKYTINNNEYNIFTILCEGQSTQRFIFASNVRDFVGKSIYYSTKNLINIYTPDEELITDLKYKGLLSDYSVNVNLFDFDDESLWSLLLDKFGINKPETYQSDTLNKDDSTNDQHSDNDDENERSATEQEEEREQISLSSEDYEDEDEEPVTKKQRTEPIQSIAKTHPVLQITSITNEQPEIISTDDSFWKGILRYEKTTNNFLEIPLVAKISKESTTSVFNNQVWPKKLTPIGVCASNNQKFNKAIFEQQYVVFSIDQEDSTEFNLLRDSLVDKSKALVVQFETKTLVITCKNKSELVGLLFPKMTLFCNPPSQEPSKETLQLIDNLKNENKRLESEICKMKEFISNQSKALLQISSVLKELSDKESSDSTLSSLMTLFGLSAVSTD